jgi:tetratricopeptide (TPR) repeat protein
MKQSILTIVLLIIINNIFSQQTELNNIDYTNSLEQKTIKSYLNNEHTDMFDLFFSITDLKVTMVPPHYKRRYFDFIIELRKEDLSDLKEKKQIRIINKRIRSKFFSRYAPISEFPEIFTKNGQFNCVSSTMLYALVFEDLNIPYQINEYPNHVNITAFPETSHIVIETTSPDKNMGMYTDDFKYQFVQMLMENKSITQNELNTLTTEQIFDKYFFTEGKISLKQLIGLEYSNKCIEKLKEVNTKAALAAAEKSMLFYPENKPVKYMISTVLLMRIAENNMNEKELKKSICKLIELNPEGNKDNLIVDLYKNLFYKTQIEQNNFMQTEMDHYDIITACKSNKSVSDKINRIYHMQLAIVYGDDRNYRKAFEHAKEAYKSSPNHREVISVFINSYITTLDDVGETDKIYEKLERDQEEFPALKNNIKFKSIKASMMLQLVSEYSEADEITKALEMIKTFENYHDSDKEMFINDKSIGFAYKAVAFYYIRTNRLNKAKEIVNNAVKRYPDNFYVSEAKLQVKQFGKRTSRVVYY